MTPFTSFISLENESQVRKLKEVHKKVLAGKDYYDIEESFTRMSEPEEWVLLLLLILFIGVKILKNRRLLSQMLLP